MKMVSAAKYAKAEKELKSARPYGSAITGKYYFFKAIGADLGGTKRNVKLDIKASNLIFMFEGEFFLGL